MYISEAISQALKGKRIRNRDWGNKAFCFAKNVVSEKPTKIMLKPAKGNTSEYGANSADLISKNWEMIGDHK